MWPWGHLAFGYLLFSPLARLGWRRPPTGGATLALALATQFPDVVDKTLSWVFHVFPQGYSVAHSVFVAVPLGIVALLAAAAWGRGDVGVAAAVGYWSHLVGDVLVAVALDEPYAFGRVLWPLVELPPYGTGFDAVGRVFYYLERWVAFLVTAENPWVVLVYVGPLVGAFLLWLVDGAPVLSDAYRALARTWRSEA